MLVYRSAGVNDPHLPGAARDLRAMAFGSVAPAPGHHVLALPDAGGSSDAGHRAATSSSEVPPPPKTRGRRTKGPRPKGDDELAREMKVRAGGMGCLEA